MLNSNSTQSNVFRNSRLLLFLFLSLSSVVRSQSTTDAEFIGMIDLTRSDMKSVSTLASQSKYAQAIEVWRDTVVNRLRRIDLDQFGWHSDRLNGKFMKWAQYLVADPTMPASTYYSSSPPYYDYYGLSGKPGATPAINWLGKPSGTMQDNGRTLADFIMFNALAGKYWQSGDTTYLKKWFDVLRDFSTRQKKLIEALPTTERKQYSPDWSATDATETLDHGTRVKNAIRELGVFVKNLPGESKISSWDNVISDIRKPVTTLAKKIPARQLADMVAGLVRDNPDILLTRYKNAGAVPNQRLNGLCAVILIGSCFPEFKATPTFMASATAGFTDYLNTMIYPDGAMLEQSFNYNGNDAGELDGMLRVWNTGNVSVTSSLKSKLNTAIQNYNRMILALSSPFFDPPLVGNGGHSDAPQLWKDAATANSWTQGSKTTSDPLSKQMSNAYKSIGVDTPSFTSIAFPYGGYYVQKNGWHWHNHYLFFNNARAARGHRMCDNNGIQVMAYGRDLLVADGQPDYFGDLPSAIGKYMGEGSSMKVNTMLVDGYSQTRQPILGSTASMPINSNLFYGPDFDYMEGNYTQGYATIDATTAIVKDVSHARRVIYLRKMGLWLITDLMQNSGTSSHTYTQTWNFAPWLPSKNTFGFTNDQVLTDATNKRIYTSDGIGPNVLLQNAGSMPNKKYTKYYGDSTKAAGFYSYGISTATPAPDVHVEISGTGNMALGTILKPFAGKVANITLKDSSTSQNVKISFSGSAKEQVRFVSGFTVSKGTHFGFNLSGKSYLAVKEANGNVYGYVLGADKTFLTWNGNTIPHGFTDYAFKRDSASKTITITTFDVPDTFTWTAQPEAIIMQTNTNPVIWKEGVITGTSSTKELLSLNIYPNPCSDMLHVDTPENGTLEITDLKGSTIIKSEVKIRTILDITHLNQGIFFIKFSGANFFKVKTFVKQ